MISLLDWIIIHNAIVQHCLIEPIDDLPSRHHYVAIIKSKACKKGKLDGTPNPMARRDKHRTLVQQSRREIRARPQSTRREEKTYY